jgi:hypothetical protein
MDNGLVKTGLVNKDSNGVLQYHSFPGYGKTEFAPEEAREGYSLYTIEFEFHNPYDGQVYMLEAVYEIPTDTYVKIYSRIKCDKYDVVSATRADGILVKGDLLWRGTGQALLAEPLIADDVIEDMEHQAAKAYKMVNEDFLAGKFNP